MSAPPYILQYTAEAEKVVADLESRQQYQVKLRKVKKALRLLRFQGPQYPGLKSHPYQSIPGPGGATLWESYVENQTPSAWRIWWIHGPGTDEITIVTIGPHP